MLSLAVAIVAVPASAGLVPMSWGFPVMTQDRSLTAFERNVAESVANEAATVAFPTSSAGFDCGTGFFGSAFPTIAQTAVRTDFLNSCRFMNEQEHFAFAYPFLSIGGAPLPALGFI
jgi:hypothetical protein